MILQAAAASSAGPRRQSRRRFPRCQRDTRVQPDGETVWYDPSVDLRCDEMHHPCGSVEDLHHVEQRSFESSYFIVDTVTHTPAESARKAIHLEGNWLGKWAGRFDPDPWFAYAPTHDGPVLTACSTAKHACRPQYEFPLVSSCC